MWLNINQKSFAYGKYRFNDFISSILNFMDPISKLDIKVEEVKKSSNYIIFIIFFILAAIIGFIAYFKIEVSYMLEVETSTIENSIPILIGILVVTFVGYGIYYFNHINMDVDNDLNNFIIPFLKKVRKYVKENDYIKLQTDLSSKLDKKYRIETGTYADSLVIPWFSAELPFDSNIKVLINLTYIINCFGKLEAAGVADALKDKKMKVEVKFVFPKKDDFKKFDYIGANYNLEWAENQKEYLLTVRTTIKCEVEFLREFDRRLGLIFDNEICNDIIDDVYSRITGFKGYLKNEPTSEEEESKELTESDYEDLENMKKYNEDNYKEDAYLSSQAKSELPVNYEDVLTEQKLQSKIESETKEPVVILSKGIPELEPEEGESQA